MENKHWHAVYTASRAEKKVRERLAEVGVECFLPVQTVVRQWSYRKAKVVVPVIAGMVFVRVERKEWVKVLEVRGVVYFLKQGGERAPAVNTVNQQVALRVRWVFYEKAGLVEV